MIAPSSEILEVIETYQRRWIYHQLLAVCCAIAVWIGYGIWRRWQTKRHYLPKREQDG